MRRLLTVVVVGAAILATTGVAQATVIFTLGNNPQQPGEENIQFQSAQTGTTITGVTNQSSTAVQFTSTGSLTVQGQGQASLGATGGGAITNPVTFSVAGHTFLDYIFNPQNGAGTATVTVLANDGMFTDSLALGNGSNFLTITTTNNETLSAVTISAP
ncbi:MAG TPA: hypothetical protein VN203_09325, partial [Candidatus Acidoferrum sp.]|nr:hypothetical protein [Candidatus Acidoferrum sp.]